MEHYQIILAYDGTDFFGSQRQAKSRRTVQGELENALRKMGWAGNSVLMAGRTDAGVHASGQVASFKFDWKHSLEDLTNALNANLPADMAVSRTNIAPADFHPRFDAIARLYRYRLFYQRQRDPLRERYAWRVHSALDGEMLHSLAALLPGKFNFAAFGSPPRPGGSTERHLMRASWREQEDEWIFEVQANAFLYHMVRRLVLAQVVIAQKKVHAEKFARALAEQVQVTSGIAPSNGLTLIAVSYPDNLKPKV
ncbi:MAG: tRNA pseudouridine(38-40) synthase TruA [Chloroflexi bacterium]|nr:MAG: tRNA pseudouridine(38-40) synthase TruA [Chloroflexota bacterium]